MYHLGLSAGYSLQLVGNMVGVPSVLGIVVVVTVAMFVIIAQTVQVLVVPAKPAIGAIGIQEDSPSPIDGSTNRIGLSSLRSKAKNDTDELA